MSLSFKVDFNLSGLTDKLKKLDEAVNTGIRGAVQAGAQVYYDEMRARVPVKSGKLKESIYQIYNKDIQIPGRAQYKLSWRKGGSGLPSAPHGHLIEYGWVQRYATYMGKDGQMHTAVRKSQQGKPAPKGRASQAAKDAYYVLRAGGPIMHAPHSFLRASYFAKEGAALKAVETEMHQRIEAALK